MSSSIAETRIRAHNFAEASENKMHSDETAAQYGFEGGLVPGVGVYAYMTVPVVQALGVAWIERGTMTGKFIKPVYHGEEVRVTAKAIAAGVPTIEMNVFNSADVLCAVGEAMLPAEVAVVEPGRHPHAPLPPKEARLEPSVEALPVGLVLGSLDWVMGLGKADGEFGTVFADDVRDPLPIYRGAAAVCHPAYITARANALLMANVALGPWIHTASRVRHMALPRDGEAVSLRGFVSGSATKKGHEMVDVDLIWSGEAGRTLGHIVHSAIVRPAIAN